MTSHPIPRANASKRRTSGMIVDWVIDILRQRGVDLREAAQAIDTPETELISPNCFLSLQKYNLLLEWASERLNDEYLGIHSGEHLGLTHLGVLGYLLLNSGTLGDFCQLTERYLAIFQRGATINFAQENDQCHCRYKILVSDIAAMRQDSEFTLTLIIQFFRQELGADWVPNETFLPHSEPEELSEHHAMFGTAIRFNQSHTGFNFDKEVLAVPVSSADPQLLQVLQNQANQLLEKIDEKLDIKSHLRLMITAYLGRKSFGANEAAEQLNMTRRTLDRHLHRAGTSFKQLRDQITVDIAKEALAHTDTSITAIALKLGYSETSAFVRAYKRLTGFNPMEYRKQAN